MAIELLYWITLAWLTPFRSHHRGFSPMVSFHHQRELFPGQQSRLIFINDVFSNARRCQFCLYWIGISMSFAQLWKFIDSKLFTSFLNDHKRYFDSFHRQLKLLLKSDINKWLTALISVSFEKTHSFNLNKYWINKSFCKKFVLSCFVENLIAWQIFRQKSLNFYEN